MERCAYRHAARRHSATYGSDAIAAVVNVITKNELRGLHAEQGSFGVSQKGDGEEKRFSIAYGFGSLAQDGWNVYAGVEWQKNNSLFSRDRGYPFNTGDLSRISRHRGPGLPDQLHPQRHPVRRQLQRLPVELCCRGRGTFDPAKLHAGGLASPTLSPGYQYLAVVRATTTAFSPCPLKSARRLGALGAR